MNKKAEKLLALAGLALLAACECPKDPQVITPVVIDDESLRGSAADFIANAGDRVFYDYDKSTLSQESEATLLRQVEWLNKHESRKVLVEGHCDPRGTREYNIGLGERRANAAAKFLLDHGISQDRVRTISYGKDRPIEAQGTQEEVYRLNRVAISVIE